MTFEQLSLSSPVLKALKVEGYTNPTPVQQQAIPHILNGQDLLGCAQTGTGKTAAFAIPILELLQKERLRGFKHIRSLVLTPTRELAVQIEESFQSYGKFTGINCVSIYGGVSQHTQTLALRNGTDVLVATPGRLLDLINQGYVHLDHLQILVLDEADRMLDMGFINDVRKILRQLPAEKQTLFFSATMPDEIAKLANALLKNPVKVEVTPVATTAEKIEQSIYMVEKRDKQQLLIHLLTDKKLERTLVFARTKHGADRIAKDLKKANIHADAIHGNKSQGARQNALSNFKNGRLKVLVATDIAARGIDVDNLGYVINFDMPNVAETYVHRIGRTGRAGSSGIAFSFCDGEERAYLKDINKLTAQVIPVVEEHPFKMVVSAFNERKPAANGRNARNYSRPKGPRNSSPSPKKFIAHLNKQS